jgi:hypothetical protein
MTMRHDARRCMYFASTWGCTGSPPLEDSRGMPRPSARPLLEASESLRDRAASCMMMRADKRTETRFVR